MSPAAYRLDGSPSDGQPAYAALAHLAGELEQLQQEGLFRSPERRLPEGTLALCSNDYLGLATQAQDADGDAPWGAGGSRLISGDDPAHRRLERALADWLGHDDSLLFSSGYAANVGVIEALAGHGDVIVSDELNHASLIDGCRLSRAEVVVTPHRELAAMDRALSEHRGARRRWVVSESYFSMDGHGPDLVQLRALCDRHGAGLIIDEAHALGVFGEAGRGLCCEQGAKPDVLIGTLGKAVGMQGAFVAGSASLRGWLWNRARSFVFSTGISPRMAELTTSRIAQVAEMDAARARLRDLSARFRTHLRERDIELGDSHGPILPWLVGDPRKTVQLSEALLERGVFVNAIRPPTVPAGSSRLRITLHAALSDDDVSRALRAVDAVLGDAVLRDAVLGNAVLLG
jgi:8-amino-7-oxononanoate synthase